MKSCPACSRSYSDDSIAFCLVDGSVLSASYDPQATLLLPASHITSFNPSSRIKIRYSVLKVFVHISRFGLAALWLFAAGAKIYMRNSPTESFFKNVGYLVGESWALPVAILVIVAEIAAAVLLLWPRTTRIGAMWSAALLIGFAGYGLYYRYALGNAEGLECGCFGGIIGSQLGVTTALRNLLLLIPAALVIFGIPRLRKTERHGPLESQISEK